MSNKTRLGERERRRGRLSFPFWDFQFYQVTKGFDLMSCDVKTLVVWLMFLIMYWLHNTVIRRDRIQRNMTPKIIFIIFVKLRMDSPAGTLLASKERLYQLENDLVYQTHGYRS